MKKKISIILLIVLVAVSVLGNKYVAKADNYKGPLYIDVFHVSSECCPDKMDLAYYPGENHLYEAKVTDENGNDVTNQYTVEWSLGMPEGVSADCAYITTEGNSCVLSVVKITGSDWSNNLIAQIHENGEEIGFGMQSFDIADGDSQSIGTPESLLHPLETATPVEDLTEELIPVSADVPSETAADDATSTADTTSLPEEKIETEENSNHTNVAIGATTAAALLCCGSAVLASKRKKK